MPTARLKRVSSERVLASILRWLTGDTKFTIVSNNCWGAHIYQALEIQYLTPFVGMFIPPKDYLLLLQRFDERMRSSLVFANKSRSDSLNLWRDRERLNYPIGLLDGCVELHFLHYTGEDDARAKWLRRCERITSDPTRRFFKFDDREGATAEDIRQFCGLPLANKVCFTATTYEVPTVVIPGELGQTHVFDGVTLSESSNRHFNALRWLSTRAGWIPLPPVL